MSAPLSPAARTLTSTSPAPGTGSGCSSITISCSRMVTARMQRSLPALQERHALDVVSLGKHVHGADLAQDPAGLHQFGGVGGERGGVAGDVDDAPGRRVDDPPDDFLCETSPGRV